MNQNNEDMQMWDSLIKVRLFYVWCIGRQYAMHLNRTEMIFTEGGGGVAGY
jgi:hypothetical protein